MIVSGLSILYIFNTLFLIVLSFLQVCLYKSPSGLDTATFILKLLFIDILNIVYQFSCHLVIYSNKLNLNINLNKLYAWVHAAACGCEVGVVLGVLAWPYPGIL